MDRATPVPTGIITFFLNDIEEGSLPRFGAGGDSGGVTTRWEQHSDA